MPEGPAAVSGKLTCQATTRAGCGGRVCLLIPLLFVLETAKHPASFALLEVALFVPFDRQDPSSSDKVPCRMLAKVNKVEDLMLFPRLVLVLFGLGKLLVVLLQVRFGSLLS